MYILFNCYTIIRGRPRRNCLISLLLLLRNRYCYYCYLTYVLLILLLLFTISYYYYYYYCYYCYIRNCLIFVLLLLSIITNC